MMNSGGKVLPDAEVLVELRRQGWRLADIAHYYGVGVSAVHHALKRAGKLKKMRSYKDIVPWFVEEEHRGAVPMRHVRAIARQAAGVPLSEDDARRLSAWFTMLAENNLVLDYHPDAPPNAASSVGGFFYRTRVDEDEDFFRAPSINQMLIERELKAGV